MTSARLRRIIHAASTSVLLIGVLGDWNLLKFILTLAVPAAGLMEAVRLHSPKFQRWLAKGVPVFRPQESNRPSGAFWLLLGYMLASWFPVPAPLAGILAGGLADPAAAAVGSRWGGGAAKSWIGSGTVGLVSAGLLIGVGFSGFTSLAAAVTAVALERWCGPLNDNLVLAPGVATSVWLLS